MLFRQGVPISAAGYGAKPAGSDKLVGPADINAHHAILIDKGNDVTNSRVGFGCVPAQRGHVSEIDGLGRVIRLHAQHVSKIIQHFRCLGDDKRGICSVILHISGHRKPVDIDRVGEKPVFGVKSGVGLLVGGVGHDAGAVRTEEG